MQNEPYHSSLPDISFLPRLTHLAWGVLGRSWGGFAHVVVIGGVRFEQERGRFWSGFGFGWGIVGGTGTRAVKSAQVRQFPWPKYIFIFCFCLDLCSLVVMFIFDCP